MDRFRACSLADGATVFEGMTHVVSVQTKEAADDLARLMNDALKIKCPPNQVVYAVAKALGSTIRANS